MSGAHHRTPDGTTVRLVIPAATIVVHGELQIQVTLPGHPDQPVHLPLVDEHFRPVVLVEAYVPDVQAGQIYRGARGELLYAVRIDDTIGVDNRLVSANGGYLYAADEAVDAFGPLTLVDELPIADYTAPPAPELPAAPPVPELPQVPAPPPPPAVPSPAYSPPPSSSLDATAVMMPVVDDAGWRP